LVDEGRVFDFLFLSGVGTKTYILPRSYIFSEHFLLTEEGAALIFDKLLKPDGLFYLDWGSSDTREARYFVASFPEDVSIEVFWATQSEYPLSGSPQFYIFASKDDKKISAIKRRLSKLSGLLNVDFRPGLEQFRTKDNKPFLQNDLSKGITFIHVALSTVILIPLLLAMHLRLRRRAGLYLRREAVFVIAGMGVGFGESLFASHNPLVSGPFCLPSWAAQHILYLAGLAIGYLLLSFARRRTGYALLLAPILVGAAVFSLFRLLGSPAVFSTAPLAGAGFGLLLAWLTASQPGKRIAAITALYLFGLGVALLLYQIPFFIGGYTVSAWLTFLIMLAVLLLQPDRHYRAK